MKSIFTYFIRFVLLFFLQFISYAQEKTLWDYPIKPGNPEWKTLKTKKQMVEVCQIPLSILDTINTKDLVTVCLNYPMFNDYVAYDDERRGVSAIIKHINGFTELSKRENGILELIKAYSEFPILTEPQKDPTANDYHTPYKLPFLELVLCDPVFLNKMSCEELEKLRKTALNKYDSKLQNSDVYSLFFNTKKTMLLITIIMDRQNSETLSPEQKETLKTFIKNYNNCTPDLLTEISTIITS